MLIDEQVNSIELKIKALQNTWKKWIEYLKPEITKKMQQLNISVTMFIARQAEIFNEIIKDGGSKASAAASALKVHTRITVAQNELFILKGGMTPQTGSGQLNRNDDQVGGKSYTFR